MTPAEIVAVKLLGWKPIATPDCCDASQRWYQQERHQIGVLSDGRCTVKTTVWPDFTDERLAWYWIRRVEDALRALDKDLFDDYMLYVTRKCDYDRRDAWLATVPQRLEAAIRVIEEAGL